MGQFEKHVFVCTGGDYCPFDGSVEVHAFLKEGIKARGLKKTVRVNKSGCLDQCGNGPMVVVYPENVWYSHVTLERAARILEEHLVGGNPVAEYFYVAPPGVNKNPKRIMEIEKAREAETAAGAHSGRGVPS